MDDRGLILEILKKAYQIEVDGYTFYSMTAEKTDKPAVKELFQKLADDEVQHQNFLRGVGKRFDKDGVSAFAMKKKPAGMEAFTNAIFTNRFKEQARGAAFEMGVVSVGLTLETNAIALFSQASKTAGSDEVKGFYTFLADWEKQHFDALNALYNAIRQEFWGTGGFAAF